MVQLFQIDQSDEDIRINYHNVKETKNGEA